MPDEFLVTPEYQSDNHKKKELIFVTTSLHILAEQLTEYNFGIQDSTGKEKFSMYRRH